MSMQHPQATPDQKEEKEEEEVKDMDGQEEEDGDEDEDEEEDMEDQEVEEGEEVDTDEDGAPDYDAVSARHEARARDVFARIRSGQVKDLDDDLTGKERFITSPLISIDDDDDPFELCADILAAVWIIYQETADPTKPIAREAMVRALQHVVDGHAAFEVYLGRPFLPLDHWLMRFIQSIDNGWQEWMGSPDEFHDEEPFPTRALMMESMAGLIRSDELPASVRVMSISMFLSQLDPLLENNDATKRNPIADWPIGADRAWWQSVRYHEYQATGTIPGALDAMIRSGMASLIDPFLTMCGDEEVRQWLAVYNEDGGAERGLNDVYMVVVSCLLGSAFELHNPRPSHEQAFATFLANPVVVASAHLNPLDEKDVVLVRSAPANNAFIRVLLASGLVPASRGPVAPSTHPDWISWTIAQLPILHRARQDMIRALASNALSDDSIDRRVMRLLRLETGAPDPLASIEWRTILQIEDQQAETCSDSEGRERLETLRARIAAIRRLRRELLQVIRVTRALEVGGSHLAPLRMERVGAPGSFVSPPRLNSNVLSLVRQFATSAITATSQRSPWYVVQQLMLLDEMLVTGQAPDDRVLPLASRIIAYIRNEPFMFLFGGDDVQVAPTTQYDGPASASSSSSSSSNYPAPVFFTMRSRVMQLLMSIIDDASAEPIANVINNNIEINRNQLHTLIEERLYPMFSPAAAGAASASLSDDSKMMK